MNTQFGHIYNGKEANTGGAYLSLLEEGKIFLPSTTPTLSPPIAAVVVALVRREESEQVARRKRGVGSHGG